MIRTLLALGGLILLFAVYGAWSFQAPGGPAPTAQGSFRLAEVTLIEARLGRSTEVSIEVRDGLLARLGASDAAPSPGLEILRGGFVLPGLMDMHTHLATDTPLALTELFGLLFLAHGVTTVRDAGDLDGSALPAVKRVYVDEGRAGPRAFGCGPFVGGPGQRWSNSVELETKDYPNADRVVAGLVDAGHACIKIYDNLQLEGIRALVRAAKEAQLPAIGHVPHGLSLEEARIPNTQHLMGVARSEDIGAGDQVIHRIMDWSQVDDARMEEVVEASAVLGLTHTPTLVSAHALHHFGDLDAARDSVDARLMPRFFRDVVWDPRIGIAAYRGFTAEILAMFAETVQKKLRITRLLHERGVPLQIGTDAPQPYVAPGVSVWTEMRLFEQAGIPAEDVWAYATWKAAKDIPVARLGRLSEGAPADFLVFAKDPTQSLEHLDSLQAVVVDGVLYLKPDLDAAVAEFQSFYGGWLLDRLSVEIAKRRLAATLREE